MDNSSYIPDLKLLKTFSVMAEDYVDGMKAEESGGTLNNFYSINALFDKDNTTFWNGTYYSDKATPTEIYASDEPWA